MSARSEWPPITEPKLLERLALGHQDFLAFVENIAALIGPREYSAEAFEHAIGYPWERPAESYLLQGANATLLSSLRDDQREALAEGRSLDGSDHPPRFPLLSFGSNAAPVRLAGKLADLPSGQHDATVIGGELVGFDVGVSAHPAVYGAIPATIFPSPGTAVRAAVIWVTIEQLTALAWSELSYFLGRLDDVAFLPDFDAPPIDGVLVFVSRLGAHVIDGEVAAMEAVEARGRTAPAFAQTELLDHVARKTFGPESRGEDVVRKLFEDYSGTYLRLREPLRAGAVPFASDHWTRFGD